MQITGCYVPLLTPLADDGRVDLEAIAPCIERLIAADVDGIVALGTTGEFADLAAEERAEVAAAAVEAAAGRLPVLVGVGAVGTTEARNHARAAEHAGAQGVLSLPPLYWKLGDDELVRHFAAVADATSLPVLLYDFPSLAGTTLTPPLVQRVARELPQVIGIKQSGPELRLVHGVISRVKRDRPDFAVMVGAVDLVLPALLAGADGTIAAIANVVPEAVVALVAAARSGRLEDAAEAHRLVLRLLGIPALSTPSILSLKAAARECGAAIAPRVRTTPAGGDTVVAAAAALVRDLGEETSRVLAAVAGDPED
jgi:2-dehydro-3-deoxy-D-pentonate aldolase